MEELTSILGIVVAAGLLLAKSAIRGQAAKAAKKHDVGSSDEAWPKIPQPEPVRPKNPRNEASVFEPIAQKVPAAKNTDRSRSPKRKQATPVQPAAAAVSAAVAPQKMPQRNAGGTTARTTARTTDGFDLRQAVIASEILRPKFDE